MLPLALYLHLPWCVRKCPYCDFNSHALRGPLPGDAYVCALLRDLEQELPLVWGRTVQSVFIGGGTPSLFTAGQIATLLGGVRAMLPLAPGAEVTLEANPGTTERDSFAGYREAGVNRVSLGVQSFDDRLLGAIGRIHGAEEALRAVEALHAAGVTNFNIDLMYALPGQSLQGALDDVEAAVACGAAHVSHYQLTLEPNTAFSADPPDLPANDAAADMQAACAERLRRGGYRQYELSAWALAGSECRHNLNYWDYGDYLGIGAGAHGKVTQPDCSIRRRVRSRHPAAWMRAAGTPEAIAEDRAIEAPERIFEFFLNGLRLPRGVARQRFEERTGLAWEAVAGRVAKAVAQGLLQEEGGRVKPSELGLRFNNDLQALFLP